MNELSLFSGAGGGLLGTKLLGFKHIGYVEYNDYCQKIIAQRIKDGILDEAPIFSDIRSFISEGYAESYQGLVDVITAGFVCKEISIANQNAKGMAEGISMETWDATAECIRIIRPKSVLLENSPEILTRGLERVINDLAIMGYSFQWCVLGCDAIGGKNHRARWWMVANADSDRSQRGSAFENSKSTSREQQAWRKTSRTFIESISRRNRNQTEPELQRTIIDVANRVDRLKAIGNGQVPAVVATAWSILSEF